MQIPTENTRAFFTAANLMTASRLALLPLIVIALVYDNHAWTAGLMVLAWLTDLADGRLARRAGNASQLGRYLDTAVDFIFIYSLFIAFYMAGRLPTYQFATLYFVKLASVTIQLAWGASHTIQDLPATPLRKLAGAFAYTYVLVLMARGFYPQAIELATVQMVLFVLMTVSIVLNTGECVAGACRRAN